MTLLELLTFLELRIPIGRTWVPGVRLVTLSLPAPLVTTLVTNALRLNPLSWVLGPLATVPHFPVIPFPRLGPEVPILELMIVMATLVLAECRYRLLVRRCARFYRRLWLALLVFIVTVHCPVGWLIVRMALLVAIPLRVEIAGVAVILMAFVLACMIVDILLEEGLGRVGRLGFSAGILGVRVLVGSVGLIIGVGGGMLLVVTVSFRGVNSTSVVMKFVVN